jgi:hypothetical protein
VQGHLALQSELRQRRSARPRLRGLCLLFVDEFGGDQRLQSSMGCPLDWMMKQRTPAMDSQTDLVIERTFSTACVYTPKNLRPHAHKPRPRARAT